MKFKTIDSFFDDHSLFRGSVPPDDFLRSLLWGLVANSMRAFEKNEGMALKEMFAPFSYFMTQTEYGAGWVDILTNTMRNGEFEFPFGIISVVDGKVLAVVLRAQEEYSLWKD